MKNFNSFEDFSNQKIDEAAINEAAAPFYDSVSQMNAILASADVAGKMEMMFIDSMTYAENLTWVIKSKDRPLFILKVTLKSNGQEYTVSKVVKTIAMP
jgi:hypothetical protein